MRKLPHIQLLEKPSAIDNFFWIDTIAKYALFTYLLIFLVPNNNILQEISFGIMSTYTIFFWINSPSNFSNNINLLLFSFFLLLSLGFFYSFAISINPLSSYSSIKTDIFTRVVFGSLVIATVIMVTKPNAKHILYLLTVSLLLVNITNIQHYINDIINSKVFIIPRGGDHRPYSDKITLLFPFLLFSIYCTKNKYLLYALYGLMLISLILLLATGARGAYLAVGFSIFIWAVYFSNIKNILLAFIIICLTLLIGSFLLDEEVFTKAMSISTSGRAGHGTWGMAWDLITQNPWKGYGYGSDIFIQIFNQNISQYPEWLIKKSIGAHNILLTTWIYGGIFLFLAFSATFIYFLVSLFKHLYNKKTSYSQYEVLHIALILSFISEIMIRGMFEDIQLEFISIIFGILLVSKNNEAH